MTTDTTDLRARLQAAFRSASALLDRVIHAFRALCTRIGRIFNRIARAACRAGWPLWPASRANRIYVHRYDQNERRAYAKAARRARTGGGGMPEPSSIWGIPIRYSTIVPDGEIWFCSGDLESPFAQRVTAGYLERFLMSPTLAHQIFRECRMTIGRECPLIAPPEWASMTSLWPPMEWRSYRESVRGMLQTIGPGLSYTR
jgi:hypothetical protein